MKNTIRFFGFFTLIALFCAGFIACDNGTTPGQTFTVSFETNGGTSVSQMTGITSIQTEPVTIRSGWTFEGWFINTDLTGTRVTFPYTVTGNTTLYAKWSLETDNSPVFVSKDGGEKTEFSSLALAFGSITTAGDYLVELHGNHTLTNRTINTSGINVTLVGIGSERTIIYSGGTSQGMFSISNAGASLTLGENITLKGRAGGSNSVLINITNGIFAMQEGSKITEHNTTSINGTIYVYGSNAKLVMEGGAITGNNSSPSSATTEAIGGVRLSNGFILMSGGGITGNTYNGTTPADVYINISTSNLGTNMDRLIMSGSAQVGAVMLLADFTSGAPAISLSAALTTGGVNFLNLCKNEADMAQVIDTWEGRKLLRATSEYTLQTTDIAKFFLGSFISNNNAQAIGSTYYLLAEGTFIGRLRPNGDPNTVYISKDYSAETGLPFVRTALKFADIDGVYEIRLTSDQALAPFFSITGSNADITIKGTGSERKILLSSKGVMFSIGSSSLSDVYIPSLTLGENITLVGRSASGNGGENNNNPVVFVQRNGRFIMLDGSKITGNYSIQSQGGGVHVLGSGSTFIMEGGEISGNTTSAAGRSGSGGGVYVNNGSFTMKGGAIKGNAAGGDYTSSVGGGGVHVNSGSFTMEGGTISGNTAIGRGGGVHISAYGTINKTNGIIFGNDATSELKNISGTGSTVYYNYSDGGTYYYRNTTLDEDDDITTEDLTKNWTKS